MLAEELEEQAAGATDLGEAVPPGVRQQVAAGQASGFHLVFFDVPPDEQRELVDVSLRELAAYSCWRAAHSTNEAGNTDLGFEAAWDILHDNEKAKWVPRWSWRNPRI